MRRAVLPLAALLAAGVANFWIGGVVFFALPLFGSPLAFLLPRKGAGTDAR